MIYECYFSPTKNTEKVVKSCSKELSLKLNAEISTINFTNKAVREKCYSFNSDDILIIGTPVYAGRVPNVLLKFLENNLVGNGAKCIAVVTYGNRNFDDALNELMLISLNNGFEVIASGAFIGEHAFSKILAKNRPDESDYIFARNLADLAYDRLQNPSIIPHLIDKNHIVKPYYKPQDADENPINILKVKPKTNANCDNCLKCVDVCPMGSISAENPAEIVGICIKCGACEKICPKGAKYYDDEGYIFHKTDLENRFSEKKQSQIF